ncbi:MAG TPA: SulP family inorganic anion transporter [Steroidobacteraceae bacterium]|jgi:MFS superfamily sulfate permease-like transporter
MKTTASVADLLAGLSIAGLLLPEAVAYSGIASLPPQAGVIALFAGLTCYGLIGGSRFAIVTATSSSAAVLASATLFLGGADPQARIAFAVILVIGTGLTFLLASSLRLGAISSLIARPVLRGYTFGLALVIAVKQWPHLVGMHARSTQFLSLLLELGQRFADWHLASLACGVAALAGLFALERLPRVPGALVVIIVSIAASASLNAHGVALTGPIHLALSRPAFALPPGAHWLPMVEFSLALMFILFAESYGSIRTYALKHEDAVQPNRDLLALGVANLVSGFLQGTPVGAGYSGTSANDAAGARSRFAGLSAAAVVGLLVWLFLPWIERIPEPALAAIVIHAVSKSLRPEVFTKYFRWQRDRTVVIASVLAVMLLGVMNGLLAAIVISIALLIRSLAKPRLAVLGRVGEHDYVDTGRFPHALTPADVLVLRPEEPLFFANAEPIMMQARGLALRQPAAKVLVLSLEESPDLDGTALENLAELCGWFAARGGELRVARLKELAREALVRARITQLQSGSLDYSSVDDAVRGHRVRPQD